MTPKKNASPATERTYPVTRKARTATPPKTSNRRDKPQKPTHDHDPELPLSPAVKDSAPDSTFATITTVPGGPRHFLQMEKGNLLTYLTYGLIYSVNMEARQRVRDTARATDLQSRFPDHLTVTPGYTADADDKQVLVEVSLSPAEISGLTPAAGVFLFDAPLPISRIVAVWSKTAASIENILASARTYSDILFPSSLLHIAPTELLNACPAPDITALPPPNTHAAELACKKAAYDRALGMLAFMKNTERYFSSHTRKYSDLAANYLATLSRLNTAILVPNQTPDQVKAGEFYVDLLSSRVTDPFFSTLVEVIRREGAFDKRTVEGIVATQVSRLEESPAKTAKRAYEDLFDDNFKACVQQLDANKKLWNLTVLSVLHRFHRKEANDRLTVKQVFPSLISDPKKAEVILALLGLYYGYAALPKNEEIASLDPILAEVVGRVHSIKFDIQNRLDRVAVETVYRLSFQGQTSDTVFEYLPTVSPHERRAEAPDPENTRLRIRTCTLLDTPIRLIEIADPIQELIKLIRETYQRGKTSGYLAFFAGRRLASTIVALHFTRQSGVQIDVDTEEVVASLQQLNSADIEEAKSCVEMDRSLAVTKKRL